MMVGSVLFAAAALAVTNAPSAFSTMVERTVPCPVVSEPKVGMKFELDLPQSLDCSIEVAVGRDDDGNDALSDEEAAIALAWSHNSVAVCIVSCHDPEAGSRCSGADDSIIAWGETPCQGANF